MTQENKELLFKDLCARLPYGVKFLRESWNFEWDQELSVIEVLEDIDKDGYINNTKVYRIEDIKPYLFPLSSMTEEQEDEWYEVFVDPLSKKLDRHTRQEGLQLQADAQAFGIEYLLKNHFDYRGLIEKGLAIDATGLDIY